MTEVRTEPLVFKESLPDCFLVHRGMLTRSLNGAYGHYDDIRDVAQAVGASIGLDGKRVGVDIVSREESLQIKDQYPKLRYGGLFGELERLRERVPEVKSFAHLRLGEVVTREVLPGLGYISHVIDPVDWLHEERDLVGDVITRILKNPNFMLEEQDEFYLDVASYDPDHADGVDVMAEYIESRAPDTVEVGGLYLFSPRRPEK